MKSLASVGRFLRRTADLILCVALALIALWMALASVEGIVHVMVGLLLTTFVPGYTLSCFLLGSRPGLTLADRVIFSVGLSVALSVFGPFLLSTTGIGIFPLTVTAFLAYLCLFLGVLGIALRWVREEGLPSELGQAFYRSRDVYRKDKLFWTTILALLVVAASVIYVTLSMPRPSVSTEFYLLGTDGTAGTLPRRLAVNESTTVIVGMYNADATEIDFNVTICLAVQNGTCPSGTPKPAQWDELLGLAVDAGFLLNMTVPGGARSQTPLTFHMTQPGLYTLFAILDGTNVHQEVHLPLRVAG